jgi:hypothetical protein
MKSIYSISTARITAEVGVGIHSKPQAIFHQSECNHAVWWPLQPIILATICEDSSEYFPVHADPAISYMYAGQDGISASYDDIYVLSLPSFTWTKVCKSLPVTDDAINFN